MKKIALFLLLSVASAAFAMESEQTKQELANKLIEMIKATHQTPDTNTAKQQILAIIQEEHDFAVRNLERRNSAPFESDAFDDLFCDLIFAYDNKSYSGGLEQAKILFTTMYTNSLANQE